MSFQLFDLDQNNSYSRARHNTYYMHRLPAMLQQEILNHAEGEVMFEGDTQLSVRIVGAKVQVYRKMSPKSHIDSVQHNRKKRITKRTVTRLSRDGVLLFQDPQLVWWAIEMKLGYTLEMYGQAMACSHRAINASIVETVGGFYLQPHGLGTDGDNQDIYSLIIDHGLTE